jgi:hypothetical protein
MTEKQASIRISDIFELVLLNPEFYLRAVSVTRLWAYIMGYTAALREAGIPFDDIEFEEFCRWVDDEYGFRTTNSCAEIVLFASHGDEFQAVERMKMRWIVFKQNRKFEKLRSND